ncbi:lytic transglycosylase domain-containing protein [Aestuariicoccus sp. MJ-SS9]|uniref:lytic transglycosylase domain-containing protein n=1 Tax=Aestuariicoccus sp. MJ-SS9 TaxID=3079855 RepID=UPI0029151A6F|nr:lytic transglycosylase domain-containing protein [Aestuariicoccus sp. MJ-SS9]MDU8911334.1 lytic transglycosylase domain-containing protein [Aestuariicoccus sp. MJ-SS9]
MSRLLALVFCVLAMPVLAQGADRPLARAMEALRDGNWAAAQIEARGDGQVALDVILWHHLRAGNGDAGQVMDFLARNPDWPGLPYLREKSEIAMAEAGHDAVLAFFGDSRPQTGTGALALARAHVAKGDPGLAEADVVIAWRTLAMSDEEQAALLAEWRPQLRAHHIARLDMALWRGWEVNARRMVPLVGEDWQALAKARLALRNNAPGVDAMIAAVPEKLRDHPGLAYERFRWRARKGRDADAIELLLERSVTADALGEPWAWARERRDLARQLMRGGDPARAYRIASAHGLTEGSDYADLEWLSGYLSLRFLNEPARALAHFQNHRDAVETPISLGRAGYWIGRAHEALGQNDAAAEAYVAGARYQTSFYGLLAAEAGGLPPDPQLAGTETFPDWRTAPFTKSSVYQAAILLLASGETVLSERFLTHLAESLDRTQIGQMGAMLEEMNRPHMQVMLGKRAAQSGIELPGPYYALHPDLIGRKNPVPTELVLAIARRESEFDPRVVSGAGARGLMQLMPGTAREVSGKLGLDYSLAGLLDDPAYNATLGAAYLAELAERFDGNAVMMAAGYNAGPSRPIRWMEERGDPRRSGIDIVDWIELIPFNETRNYVMRVTESLPVYRARLGLNPHPVPFSQELTGSTLLPRAPEGE